MVSELKWIRSNVVSIAECKTGTVFVSLSETSWGPECWAARVVMFRADGCAELREAKNKLVGSKFDNRFQAEKFVEELLIDKRAPFEWVKIRGSVSHEYCIWNGITLTIRPTADQTKQWYWSVVAENPKSGNSGCFGLVSDCKKMAENLAIEIFDARKNL